MRSKEGWWLAFFTTESTENTEIGKEEGVRTGQTQPIPFRSGSVAAVLSVVK
jgi:hypothetical protein